MTGEIAGPDYNGGIGTANRGLALALRNAGFAVDVLYTRVENGAPFCFRGSFEEQVAAFRALGINLMCISHGGQWNDWLAKSLRVLEVLQSKSYDVAFFDDTHGSAYYTALARHTGSPALTQTRVVVVTHSATQWICDLNQAPVTTLADARLLEIERRSIELADYVVSPSAYILRKYQSYGWALPRNTLVRPNILPFSAERAVPASRAVDIDEIVFFGRMERRKGIWLFCEALDRIKYELAGRKVTFLGKFTQEDGESTGYALLRKAAQWPFEPTLLFNYDREQALAYLKGGNRLAVMPSREDNSPCVILECLIEGIPFIASSGSGGQELISAADHEQCLFEPTADGLTAKLRSVLAKGAVTGQPSFVPQDNARQTMQWVSSIVAEVRGDATAASGRAKGEQRKPRPPQRTIILLTPDSLSPQQVTDGAREWAQRNPDSWVVVFANDGPRPTPGANGAEPDNLRFCAIASFAAETAKMEKAGGMLMLCRIDQPVPAEMLARAAAAFQNTGIDALTAMRGHAMESVRPDQPYVFSGPQHWVPEDYRTGNCSALMALAQDSNAGVVILRAARAGLLTRLSPLDPQLCRLKDIGIYIHEILLALSAEGGSFELLPDCFIPAAALPASIETFAFPGVAMRHLLATRSIKPGSEAALLSRLTIEKFATEAGRENALDLLSGLSSRMGESILEPHNYWPPSRGFTTYAKIAHATGRPDLSLALTTNALATDNPFLRGVGTTPSAIAQRRAQITDLSSFMAQGRFATLNLDHPWSLRTDYDRQEIEIHPNGSREGDATLMFNGLSFPTPTVFFGEIELLSLAKGPVRFMMEFQAPNSDTQAMEWVLQPGERKSVECILPEAIQSGFDLLLATRMMRRSDSTEGAHAKWHRPAFRPL